MAEEAAATGNGAPAHAGEGEPLTEDKGVLKKILKEGDGSKPEEYFEITAHYTGYLMDGTKFDSSRDRGQPFKFTLGKGRCWSSVGLLLTALQ